MKILIVNGPKLNLLGTREPQIYGNVSFEDYFETLKDEFKMDLSYFQSDNEQELISALKTSSADGIIINAGSFTHSSIALRDSISAISIPVVEVHISNISARESFRHESFLSPVCVGCIFGFGLKSYALALQYFNQK
ncbi:MAG: 3-dehydroquinate dehydratase [Flavobacteriales bacterium]|jgi:3-dehydroquinate dehydratase-2|nr:3-dehydroquinate dehydratase [Flavobacteriales bacterium]